jgi:aryl-phospho-beta-D-glucosidase BglC (GH1 family)
MKKHLRNQRKTPSTLLFNRSAGAKKSNKFFLTLIGLLLFNTCLFAQFVHRDGKKIIDKDGNEIILRGMGLGGWMLQEGYMLETNAFANPQHQIRAKIVDVIGEANTQEFYNAWWANHVTKRDIDSLKAWGFNSVRLPMHYNLFTLPIQSESVPGQQTWLDKGFEMTDALLSWCKANNIYLILDLHATPGGQGHDAAISDYDATKPSLWEDAANRAKAVALWKKLAERYKDEPMIAGYDLINEPNWNFTGANVNGCNETTNAPLKQLYNDIIAAIRTVDTNHMVIIEGNCWGNNHAGLWPFTETNIAASFHKYWNYNDAGSISGLINLRNTYNVPIWVGETGENSNTWFTNAISLLESNDIGWAWWPLKKVGGINSPFSVVRKQGYSDLINYWQNGGTKPSVAVAKASLMELAEGLKIDNVLYRKDIPDAMFRQVQSSETIPYEHHAVPGVVHATDYDLGRNNAAYKDVDTANYQVATGSFAGWNNGWAYRNDGVDIEKSSDASADANGYDVGWTADGEWLQYTLDVDSSAAYNVVVRYGAASANTRIRFSANGNINSETVALPSTGGFQTFNEYTVNDVILKKGQQKFRFNFLKGGANVSLLKFVLSKKLNEVAFKALGAETTTEGDAIYLTLNKDVDATTIGGTGFVVKINGSAATISSVEPAAKANQIKITLAESFADNNVLTITYNADDVKSTDATLLADFTDLAITNNLPFHFALPTKVEAEAFVVNQGLTSETTTDAGGGQDMGYTNAGDYLDYRIRVATAGTFRIEARVASAGTAGKIEFQQRTKEGTVLNTTTVNTPVTGGWQTWTTVTANIRLDEGAGILRVLVVTPEFNMNWFNFKQLSVAGTEGDQGSLNLYPNPSNGKLHIEFPEAAFSMNNALMIKSITGSDVQRKEKLTFKDLQNVDVRGIPPGVYIVEFQMNGKQWRNKVIFKSDAN